MTFVYQLDSVNVLGVFMQQKKSRGGKEACPTTGGVGSTDSSWDKKLKSLKQITFF